MTWGNWLFWGILVFFGINFLWLGALEEYIPLWVGTAIALIAFFALLIFGPREKAEEEEA